MACVSLPHKSSGDLGFSSTLSALDHCVKSLTGPIQYLYLISSYDVLGPGLKRCNSLLDVSQAHNTSPRPQSGDCGGGSNPFMTSRK